MQIRINDHFLDYLADWDHYIYMLMGGYGSSKSFNTALKLILKASQEHRRFLIIRETYNTHRESTYQDLIDAIEFLGLEQYFDWKVSPLSIVCKSTGSKFIFRGLDDRKKLKSVKDISIVWIEEGEGTHDDYKELKDRMRIAGVKPHMFVTYNPVSKNHWTYKEFFYDREYDELKQDEEEFYNKKIISKNDIYYHHSTYEDNVFLNETWIKNLLSEKNPILRSIKALGRFGTLGKKIFTNVKSISKEEIAKKIKESQGLEYRGMDWGFSVSQNALVEMIADREKKELYIFSEFYKKGLKNSEIMEAISHLRDTRVKFTADSNESKTIKEFEDAGFRIRSAIKGPGSVRTGIKKLQEFDTIYISEECPNCLREFESLEHPKDEKTGEIDEDKFNIDPHTVDAVRYGLEEFASFSSSLKEFFRNRR